jgi:CRISPR-associated protein Cmr2
VSTSTYTAISFAPVQGFIEKSRKLRDLFGASLILSYLSQKIVEEFHKPPEFEVISPALVDVQEGMPNRILVKGSFIERDRVKNVLLQHWQHLLTVCREWVEENLGIPKENYHWSQKEDQIGKQKGEWESWGSYTWEVFWGSGVSPQAAMEDLETRKLKRDWTAINWMGESSSLSGTDAIAWNRLGDSELTERELKGELTAEEKQELKRELENFYLRLSKALEQNSSEDPQGKFLRPNERLSIPELVKRLVTRYEDIGERLDKSFRIDSFSEMVRMPEPGQPGHWTGWFMGDGDSVGDKLKELANHSDGIQALRTFSNSMRKWGRDFKRDFSEDLGRVIYAGGDDFLGVIYSKDPNAPISERRALEWLMKLNDQWKKHGQDITVSVGFVWAGHSVPQRDVLQHCREAERRAKALGKNRVNIRVLFNSGQYVQWACPWNYLDILTKYRDRDRINTQEELKKDSKKKANWNHIYNDWATLKARHAIRLQTMKGIEINKQIALSIFDLYFDDVAKTFEAERLWDKLAGDNTASAIVNWIDDLIQVGWQLCRNSDL